MIARKCWGLRVLCAVIGLGLFTAHGRAEMIIGSASGTFVNPLPNVNNSGAGTSTFRWGHAASLGDVRNRLKFTGTSFNTATETDFLLGTLEFRNGTVLNEPLPSTVDLSVALNFTTPPAGALPPSNFTLGLYSTPNTGTPDQNADYVYLPSAFSTTTFTIGSTVYTLQILGFRNIVGDGYLNSSATELHVREDGTATAELWGRVTSYLPPNLSPVPEPATMTSLCIGLVVMAGYRRRRRRLALES